MMEYTFEIHWQLRKGLGPDWIDKHETIFLDDLPSETTFEEAKNMAVFQFKVNRAAAATSDSEYIIKDIEVS